MAHGENSNLGGDQFEDMNLKIERAQKASDLAWKLKDSYPDSSLQYAQDALRLSKETNQKKLEAFSLSDIGNYYKRKEKYELAYNYYLESLEIRKELDNLEDIISVYNQIGLLFKQQEKYDSAAIYFSAGITKLKADELPQLKLKLYDGYALTLYHIGRSEEALTYADKAYLLAEAIGDSLSLAKSIQNKGAINLYLGNYLLALNYFERAEMLYADLQNINGRIDTWINQAAILSLQGENRKAESLLLKAEEKSLSHGFLGNLFNIYMDLALIYKTDRFKSQAYYQMAYTNAVQTDKLHGRIESAIQLGLLAIEFDELLKAEKFISELDTFDIHTKPLKIRFDFYRLKSAYFGRTNAHEESLVYLTKAMEIQDSLFKSINHLQDIFAMLDYERNEKELTKEKLRRSLAEQESINNKNARNQMLIWFLGLSLVLLALLFFAKRKRLKVEHEKRLQEAKYEALIKEKTYEANLTFFNESLKLEQEIREKIGRDLHDELGSKLAVIQMTLEGLKRKKNESAFKQVIGLVDQSCKDMRLISHDLIHQDFASKSLPNALEKHCESITSSGGLKIDFGLIGIPRKLPFDIKKHLHAIVTLLIDNIIQHAQANKASLQLFYHNDSINIELIDNGKGFELVDIDNRGVGLHNAKIRIKEIGGSLEIETAKDNGTYISIIIPMDNEN